jgi:hypothetical protein
MTIKLTDAQVSALECSGLEELHPEFDADLFVLREAWKGQTLVVTADTRDALFSALIDRANAESETPDADVFARRAARSLGTLASRVLRAA